MALRTHYPYGHLGRFKILSNGEVSETLKECQEADVRLLIYSLEHEAIAEVLIPIVDIGFGLTYQHQVDDLLACITMLVQKCTILQIHVFLYVTNTPRNNNRVNQQNDSLTISLIKQTHIGLDQIVNDRNILGSLNRNFGALMRLYWALGGRHTTLLRYDQAYVSFPIVASVV